MPTLQGEPEERYIQELLRTGRYKILPIPVSVPSTAVVTTEHTPLLTSTPAAFVTHETPTPERIYRERHLKHETPSVNFKDDLRSHISLSSPVVSACDSYVGEADRHKYQTQSLRQSLPQRLDSMYTIPFDDQSLPPRPPLPSVYSSNFDRTFSSMKVPKLSEFSGEGASEFEIWKYDVNCLINEGVYPTHIIREAMRRSLKGVARGVLLHLGESASVIDILTELEGVYGNVRPVEKLKEMFYSESQREGESVADYSLRLERLLSLVPETLDRYSRNEMLKNRLWSGLRDQELKNVSRYLFEKIVDFNTLRRELRAIEEDLRSQKVSRTEKKLEVKTPDMEKGKVEVAEAKQFVSLVESQILKQMEALTKQMSRMESKLGELDKEVKEFKRSQRRSPWRSQENKKEVGIQSSVPTSTSVETKDSALNSKGPLSQGR